jgi:hypothetical protein
MKVTKFQNKIPCVHDKCECVNYLFPHVITFIVELNHKQNSFSSPFFPVLFFTQIFFTNRCSFPYTFLDCIQEVITHTNFTA